MFPCPFCVHPRLFLIFPAKNREDAKEPDSPDFAILTMI